MRTLFRNPSPKGDSEPISSLFVESAIGKISMLARQFVNEMLNTDVSISEMEKWVLDAMDLYEKRPIEDNSGGGTFNNMLWIYLLARALEPETIIESGVWKGQSTFFLHKAAPGAAIKAFDISFKRLEYRNSEVQYCEHDWTLADWDVKCGSKTLAFFDDHINQARRILEAKERGLKYLIFDDNLPFYMSYKDRPRNLPTIEMLYDDSLPSEMHLEWTFYGKSYEASLDMNEWKHAKDLILRWKSVPLVAIDSMGAKHPFGGPSKLAFVVLK